MSDTMQTHDTADIDAMLADLDMPMEAIEEAAGIEANPADIIEEAPEPLNEAETAEIAEAVAQIEAEAGTPITEIELTAIDLTPAQPVVEASAEPVIEIGEEDIAAALQELDLDAARQEAYAEQDENAVVEDESVKPAEPAPAGAKPEKKAKAPKAAATPKAPRVNVTDLPEAAFILDTTVDDTDAAAMSANKVAVLGRRPAQVKVAEKFDNLLLSVNAGRLPSTYTVDCYRVLKASGSTNSAALAAALTSTSKKNDVSATYTIGTARSQAGQFMALAPALKIATRVGKELVLNPDSLIAASLDHLLGL